MAHNDLRDCWHDAKKGKSFAAEHRKSFTIFVVVLWIIATIGSLFLLLQNCWYLLIAFGMIVSGLAYSELRQIPFVPNTMVALTIASSVLYPVCWGKVFLPELWSVFLIVMCLMYSREILKDFDDKEIDPGYKWTLLQKYQDDFAQFIAMCIIAAGSRLTEILTWPLLGLPGKILQVPSLTLLFNEPNSETIKAAKLQLDLGLLMIALIFLLR